MTQTPLEVYQKQIAAGGLTADPAQCRAAECLDQLYHDVLAAQKPRLLSFTGKKKPHTQGLYMHGSVGRGKSMLMDLFFDTVPLENKIRLHFHEFMRDIHDELNLVRNYSSKSSPVAHVAEEFAQKYRLLCFDEFHVNNIADAMILSRLFGALFSHGVILVATSNWAPEDLYKNGLQRELFLPFIDLLRDHVTVLDLEDGRDYRLNRAKNIKAYHTPLGKKSTAALNKIFTDITGGATPEEESLVIKGRTLAVPKSAKRVAQFSFSDLCEQPLGAQDYLTLAEQYSTLVLDKIPVMTDDDRNEARRFMTLIDALYDKRVRLICAAAAAPEKLYPAGDGAVEFRRTVSRLQEMQSRDYLLHGAAKKSSSSSKKRGKT